MEEIAQQAFGDALFSLALERNQLKVWRREAEAVAEILKKEEAFVALVSGPWPEKELRIKLLREVFGERVSPELLEWMTLSAEQGVFCHIQAMIGRFVRNGGPAASERAGHSHGARRTERGAEEAGGAMPEQKHRGRAGGYPVPQGRFSDRRDDGPHRGSGAGRQRENQAAQDEGGASDMEWKGRGRVAVKLHPEGNQCG